MVQVLPYVPTIAERLAPALEQGFGEIANKTILERNLGQLQSAQNPKDLATALVRLQASHPGLDRSLGPLLTALSTSMQGSLPPTGGPTLQVGGANEPSPIQRYSPVQKSARIAQEVGSFPGRTLTPRERPVAQPPEEQRIEPAQEVPGVLNQGQQFQPGSYQTVPEDQLYTPQQFKQEIDTAFQEGRDPTPKIQAMEAHNARVEQATNIRNTNIDTQNRQLENQLNLSKAIYNDIKTKLPPSTDPNTEALYTRWVQDELPKHKDISSAQAAVTKKIFDFDKTRQEVIKSIPNNPFLGITDAQAAKIHNSVKPLLAADPLAYNILEAAIVDPAKGNNIFDAAKILHPLDSNTKKYIDSIPDYREEKKLSPLSARGMGGASLVIMQAQQAEKKQAAQVAEVADGLKKIWTKDTSLLNIYADMVRKGWMPNQITSVLDRLEPLFNSQQQTERSQLNSPPPIPARHLLT